MEITFMPRKRMQSLNFLERFRGKVNKINRYSGLMGVLNGNSHRYEKDQEHSRVSATRSVKTIEHTTHIYSKTKRYLLHSIDRTQDQSQSQEINSMNTQRRKFYKLKTENDHLNDQNINIANLEIQPIELPKVNSKCLAHSKYKKMVKSRTSTHNSAKLIESKIKNFEIHTKQNIQEEGQEFN